jgi:hypothetical protein
VLFLSFGDEHYWHILCSDNLLAGKVGLFVQSSNSGLEHSADKGFLIAIQKDGKGD